MKFGSFYHPLIFGKWKRRHFRQQSHWKSPKNSTTFYFGPLASSPSFRKLLSLCQPLSKTQQNPQTNNRTSFANTSENYYKKKRRQKMASRRLTKTTFAALKSARHNKLSLAQSGSRAKSISTFTNFSNSLSRPPIENKLILPPNDVVSAKLSFTTVGFARKFHSSTPLRSSTTGVSQVRTHITDI